MNIHSQILGTLNCTIFAMRTFSQNSIFAFYTVILLFVIYNIKMSTEMFSTSLKNATKVHTNISWKPLVGQDNGKGPRMGLAPLLLARPTSHYEQ